MNFLFWAAVVLLVDAAIGFGGLNYWDRVMPKLNVRLLATVEMLVAALLLLIYFAGRWLG